MGNTTSRRAFLAGAAGLAATAALPRWAHAQAANVTFPHGVGSFEPLADRVLIWTRTTAAAAVDWAVARDDGFTNIVKSGNVAVNAAADHTVLVDVDGLAANTTYWYRFTTGAATSTVGRMRTLPAAGADVERVRVGVVTCAEWEFGRFGAYRLVAERDDLEFVLALGDYIYEFGNSYGPLPSPQTGGRRHEPPRELHTLDEYRTRYQQYRSDPELQLLHARHTFMAIYDDHEVANDWYRDGAEQHTVPDEGDWTTRRNAALQAYREWLPFRGGTAHRRVEVGDLVDLLMLDERLYRDKQPMNAIVGYLSVDPMTDDPNRTMLGVAQRDWLTTNLKASVAKWKVLGNPVAMMPIDVGPPLAGVLSAALSGLGTPLPPVPPPLAVEGWDGYNAERQRIFDFIDDNDIEDVVVLTGDYHEAFATHLPVDRATWQLDRNSAAVEFIAPAITSPGLAETLQMGSLPQALTINTVFEANLVASNPWVSYHDGFQQGYAVAEFRGDGMQYDFWFVDDRTVATTGAHHGASYAVTRGASVLREVPDPLGARPAIHTTAPGSPLPVDVIPVTGGVGMPALIAGVAAMAALAARRAVATELAD